MIYSVVYDLISTALKLFVRLNNYCISPVQLISTGSIQVDMDWKVLIFSGELILIQLRLNMFSTSSANNNIYKNWIDMDWIGWMILGNIIYHHQMEYILTQNYYHLHIFTYIHTFILRNLIIIITVWKVQKINIYWI